MPVAYCDAAPVQTLESGKPSVLILDDNFLFRDLLKQIFVDAGFSVIAVGDAATALRTLVEHDFDLLIADIMLCDDLSNIDGREVVLAAKRINTKTRVIICSAYIGMLEEIMKDPKMLPFDEILSKGGFKVKDLIDVAKRLVQK